jgi:hypothetical protein
MADESVARIGENSPEQVAYKLMQEVAQVERIVIGAGDLPPYWTRAGRAWILDTYQECLYAVANPKKPAYQW